jgi:orotate phosphoribosyltransferase
VERSAELIALMVQADALKFGTFTLKSGRVSPYFVNTGAYGAVADLLELSRLYADLIERSDVTFNVLYGPAYKGIPLAAATGTELARRGWNGKYAFNRKEPKDHGDGGEIIGYVPQDGDRVAIIEDVTTAGTSVRETRELFARLGIGAKIVALYISIDRMERGSDGRSATQQIREDYGIEVHSIATTRDIVEYLRSTPPDCAPIPDAEEHARKIEAYLKDYGVS